MNENMGCLKQELKKTLFEKIDLSREVSDEEVQELIDELITSKSRENYMTIRERDRLRRELFYSVRKLDILQQLVEDDNITEIMVNGQDNIFVEENGRLRRWNGGFESKEKLEDVIQQIAAKGNRSVNEASPIVDTRLENGSRVNVVLSPVALNGPILTIRRFPKQPFQMEDLKRMGALSEEAAQFLKTLVAAGYNLFISGGTGSGKTTFLNALARFIPKDERIITIEDSAELQIRGIPNLVRMETRTSGGEGCREITIRDLIKTALRMRPDRIIIGEVRGAEAIDLLQCLNTGHDGSISTGHANSSKDMLSRLETMVLMGMDLPLAAIRRQIASALDIIIHLGRLRDKSRRVLEITEIVGYVEGEIQTAPLFVYEEDKGAAGEKMNGRLIKKGELRHTQKLSLAGIKMIADCKEGETACKGS